MSFTTSSYFTSQAIWSSTPSHTSTSWESNASNAYRSPFRRGPETISPILTPCTYTAYSDSSDNSNPTTYPSDSQDQMYRAQFRAEIEALGKSGYNDMNRVKSWVSNVRDAVKSCNESRRPARIQTAQSPATMDTSSSSVSARRCVANSMQISLHYSRPSGFTSDHAGFGTRVLSSIHIQTQEINLANESSIDAHLDSPPPCRIPFSSTLPNFET